MKDCTYITEEMLETSMLEVQRASARANKQEFNVILHGNHPQVVCMALLMVRMEYYQVIGLSSSLIVDTSKKE